MGRVIAIVNQKGGVGKTTTAVNLGAFLAGSRRRVLVVDADPQGNATTGLGVERSKVELSVADVLLNGVAAKEAMLDSPWENLCLLPSSIDLAGAEVRLAGDEARERKLRESLQPAAGDFDFILLDSPPSLGLLPVNCLVAADGVIVPLQCEYYALEGLAQLQNLIELVRGGLNANLEIEGLLLTMFDARNRICWEVAEQVREHFGEMVFETVIPRNVRLSEAPSYGLPVSHYSPGCPGAVAYENLAKEVISREQARFRQNA